MNAQHTPGPWKATGLSVYAAPETKSFGDGPSRKYERIICSANDNGLLDQDEPNYRHRVNGIQGNNVRFPGYSEAQANARLIASAPELLEALVGLRDYFCGGIKDGYLCPEIQKANDAIAKARGQT